jgi:hypothetical protein
MTLPGGSKRIIEVRTFEQTNNRTNEVRSKKWMVYQKENLLTKSFVVLCVALCDPLWFR